MNASLFTCSGCGACCYRLGYPPFDFASAEFASLEEQRPELAIGVRHAAAVGDSSAACPWLDTATKRCRHYDLRPKVCRDFALGSPKCIELRWLKGIE